MRKHVTWLFACAWLLTGFASCHAAPASALRRAIEPGVRAHAGLSGFRLITRGEDALLLRIALIQAAQHSVKIQYYSFQDDEAGKLLLEAVLRAADRGVRVRILIDDLTIKKTDPTWALLDSHPSIALCVFNPLAPPEQGIVGAVAGAMTDFKRYNKRMHNKVIIADDQLAIIGGRNVGDAYFDNSQDFNFRDMDILAAGPIVAHIAANFGSFWRDDAAFPVADPNPYADDPDALTPLRTTLATYWREAVEKGLLPPIPPIIEQLRSGQLPLIWAKAELAADLPGKVEQATEDTHSRPMFKLQQMAERAAQEFLIVSPYFIPGDDGMIWLQDIVERGVAVRVLTNSLASTDVIAAHTGYRHYREALLENGVELYEMKPHPGIKKKRSGRFASASRASLHTKIFVLDRRDIIIGTMNFDPRSVQLNTEIALVIHSEAIAAQLAQMFERATDPDASYQLALTDDVQLEWLASENGQDVTYDHEPHAGFWRRVKASFYALMPFEGQL